MNVLILGSGGREHALGKKISESSQCKNLFFCSWKYWHKNSRTKYKHITKRF